MVTATIPAELPDTLYLAMWEAGGPPAIALTRTAPGALSWTSAAYYRPCAVTAGHLPVEPPDSGGRIHLCP